MNNEQAELCRRWASRLRSDEETQTFGSLMRTAALDEDHPVGKCCLGVLACMLDVPHEPDRDRTIELFTFSMDPDALHPETFGGIPPADWFEDNTGLPATFRDRLASLNDNHHNFYVIAEHIDSAIIMSGHNLG